MTVTTTVGRAITFVGVAILAWAASGMALLRIPGSPLHEQLKVMYTLDSFREDPENPRANEAFDEFLRIGAQAELVESTVMPALAAVAVVLLSVVWSPLTRLEFRVVVGAIAVALVLRTRLSRLDWLNVVEVGVFAGVLWAGTYLAMKTRRPKPVA